MMRGCSEGARRLVWEEEEEEEEDAVAVDRTVTNEN
jgi:hypothetical protein